MITKTETSQAVKTVAIATADAHLSNAGLPTYSEMFGAIEHLHENSWLDSDPCETEDLGVAKDTARRAYEAAKSSFHGLHAIQS
jgi:hypothetical protein